MLIKAVGLPTDVFSDLFTSMKPGTVAIGMESELDQVRSDEEVWLFGPSAWVRFVERLLDYQLHEEVTYLGDAVWEKIPLQRSPLVWWPRGYQLSSDMAPLAAQLAQDEDWLSLLRIIEPWFIRPDLPDSYLLLQGLTECSTCLGQRSQVREASDLWFAQQSSLGWSQLRQPPYDPELVAHVDECEACQMVMDYVHYQECFKRLWDNCSLDGEAQGGFLSGYERRKWLLGLCDEEDDLSARRHLMRCERCREIILYEAQQLMHDPAHAREVGRRLGSLLLKPLP